MQYFTDFRFIEAGEMFLDGSFVFNKELIAEAWIRLDDHGYAYANKGFKCDLECDVEIRFDPSLGKYKKTLS